MKALLFLVIAFSTFWGFNAKAQCQGGCTVVFSGDPGSGVVINAINNVTREVTQIFGDRTVADIYRDITWLSNQGPVTNISGLPINYYDMQDALDTFGGSEAEFSMNVGGSGCFLEMGCDQQGAPRSPYEESRSWGW